MKTNLLSLLKACSFFALPILSFAQPTSWTARDVGGGGAVYAPSINPHNPSEIYLSCDMGVMFQSADSAKTWNTLHFNNLIGNKNSEVQFTNDTKIRYVLRQNVNNSLYVPNITTDGGNNWKAISPTNLGNFGAFKIYASPLNSNTIIVSGYDKIFFSNTSGQSYSTIYTATSGIHLAGVFFDNNVIYVATNQGLLAIDNNGNSVLNFTTHQSNGITNSQEQLVSFSGAKQGNVLRFIGVTLVQQNFSPRTFGSDVSYFSNLYRMDYSTSTNWTNLTSNFRLNAPNNKAYNIAMKADDVNTFYLGGSAKVPETSTGILLGTVFKTTDGGNTFSNVFLNSSYTTNANITTGWQGTNNGGTKWNGNKWNAINTTEGLTVSQKDINYLVRADKSNVYISTDGGTTWKQRYVNPKSEHNTNTIIKQTDTYVGNGLQSTVTYWLTWLDKNNLYSGFADLLAIRSKDAGQSWSFDYTGLDTTKVNDISMMKIHSDDKIYAATGDVPGSNGDYSDLRTSQANRGRVSVSSDGGQTWQTFYSFKRSVLGIDFNPLNPQEMYVTVGSELGGIGGIYKFTDKSNPLSITQIPSPVGTENRPGKITILNDGSLVCYFAARDNGSTGPSYVYSASSGVFYTKDDGKNWLQNNLPGMKYDVRYLAIDPNDPNQDTWYACVGKNGSSSVPGVYKTIDRGSTWNLYIPSKTAVTCTFHPYLTNEMYLCTQDEGLYYYTNMDANPTPNFVSSYPFKQPQQVFINPYNYNEVWVTSFGNGLKVGYTNLNLSEIKEEQTNLLAYPNPVNDKLIFPKTIKNITIYDQQGKLIFATDKEISQIETKDFENGLYILKSESYHLKFIVKH